jgi:hypothetical protein
MSRKRKKAPAPARRWVPHSATNRLWRAVRRGREAHRDEVQRGHEDKLARLVALGQCDARPRGQYSWRIVTREPPQEVDFWSRTGRWRTPDGRREGQGWHTLLAFLRITPKKRKTVARGTSHTKGETGTP